MHVVRECVMPFATVFYITFFWITLGCLPHDSTPGTPKNMDSPCTVDSPLGSHSLTPPFVFPLVHSLNLSPLHTAPVHMHRLHSKLFNHLLTYNQQNIHVFTVFSSSVCSVSLLHILFLAFLFSVNTWRVFSSLPASYIVLDLSDRTFHSCTHLYSKRGKVCSASRVRVIASCQSLY